MRSERRGELHGHVALVATDRDAAPQGAAAMPAMRAAASRFSLLRLSLMGRLLIVAATSALLWGAVFWALR